MKKFFSWSFLGILLIVIFFFSSIVTLITDWWWFSEVGFTEIFIKSLTVQIAVGFAAGLFSLAFLLLNFFLAAQKKIPWMASLPQSLMGQPLSFSDRTVKRIGVLLSVVVSVFIGFLAASYWEQFLQFMAFVPFDQKDPILGRDVSFYVFQLPVYSLSLGIFKILILLSLIGCGIVYVLRGRLNISGILGKLTPGTPSGKNGHPHFKDATQPTGTGTKLHMGILLFLFFVTLAGGSYLSLFNLLTTQNGPAFTDANVLIPLLYVSVATYGLASLAALSYGIGGKIAPLVGTILLTFVVNLASSVIPSIYQKLIVAPNELVKETPYIKYNIAATQKAYGLGQIERHQIEGDKPLTASDIAANNLTIKNVRLWDREPLLSTFSQLQEIRTYYEFASVDNDRYTIDGEIRQIMLSPRELATESLPNKNWINEHLTFTHGYGIAAGPVNQVTPEGLPVLFVKDLPPKVDKKELQITRPEIYYGELVNDYIIANTNSKEFDYPKGEENVYSKYKGSGGVQLDSPLKRLAYAFHFSSLKMLLSSDITPQSRILYTRHIKDRVEKIAPFLTFDNDPYQVVADGKLYWILDGYTHTDRYPYSQQMSYQEKNVNYIRNSVKAVVNAYDGKVAFYQSDAEDPIIRTYSKIFPTSFHPLSEMPKSLLPHLRYPEDIFTIQTSIYATYHMNDPQNFYNKEDQWEIPSIAPETVMTPRHMIMKLPNATKEEFILMLPFTPRAKDNLSAWIVARNDGSQYGKLAVYTFPKDKLIFGPKQIVGRINQDAEVSRQISLWDQRGSQVIQGPLLVIPIEKSLVYVRPLYLKAETGKIPELKRIIVAYENKIAMEETLEKGLAKIFGTTSDQQQAANQPTTATTNKPPTPATANNDPLLKQASQAYDAAISAQKSGDWAKYGEEIKKLGDILQQLQ